MGFQQTGIRSSLVVSRYTSMKHFWKPLRMGYLHSSARRGIIMMIPKKSKNANLLANWRSLMLLDMDFKLILKVLAYKMKKFLDNTYKKGPKGIFAR